MTNLCPSCGSRRARRACPALGRDICAVCCGTKRQVEIRCPPSCAYLSSARAHPAAIVVRRRENDIRFLAPLVQDLTQPQYGLMLFFQRLVLKHARGILPPLIDEEVAAAAAAVAATLETARKGIIYEHQADSGPAQRLASEFSRALGELSREQGAPPAATLERDAAVALRRIEGAARAAATALEGEPPVFLSLLSRLMSHQERDAQGPSDDPDEARLIVPG